VKISIVDPHGFHLGDALPKLRGLASYAAEFGSEVHRIEAVAEMRDKKLRVLDIKSQNVREAISASDDVETLYLSDSAMDY
jgi:type III restriction enzyme